MQINYQPVIGLEAHIQLNTQSKAFCSDAVQTGAAPNTLISPISLAYPGTLPHINYAHIQKAVSLALALNCHLNNNSYFERKNYTYTDLPKGYQITQDSRPIATHGYLPVLLPDGNWKNIQIHHIHLEEDAGKSIHDQEPNYTVLDLNRAGTPLIEVVTQPVLHTPETVEAFMLSLQNLIRWIGISDGNMEKGNLRCDVNISIRPESSNDLYDRCEIKNMNSMKFAKQAIRYEIKRQTQIVQSGNKVIQQTLQFLPKEGITKPIRQKENAHDYRYFPEPDIPPIVLDSQIISNSQKNINHLPWTKHQKWVSEYKINIKDAQTIIFNKYHSLVFEDLIRIGKSSQKTELTNLFIQKIRPLLNDVTENLSSKTLPLKAWAELPSIVDQGIITQNIAYKKLFPLIWKYPNTPINKLIEDNDLGINESNTDINQIIQDLIQNNPKKVNAYKNGKKGLLGFFMGQVMRRTKGKAEPKVAEMILKEKLGH